MQVPYNQPWEPDSQGYESSQEDVCDIQELEWCTLAWVVVCTQE